MLPLFKHRRYVAINDIVSPPRVDNMTTATDVYITMRVAAMPPRCSVVAVDIYSRRLRARHDIDDGVTIRAPER